MSKLEFSMKIINALEKALITAGYQIPESTPEFLKLYEEAIHRGVAACRGQMPRIVQMVEAADADIR
jgi:hypothetical protein